MTTRGNPEALAVGPGKLYGGALGTVEPTDLTTPWSSVDPGWFAFGYTEAGSEFDQQLATTPIKVAEELDTILNTPSDRTSSLAFALAQMTATNLEAALNGGTITNGAGIITFEPPDLGEEVRLMLGFESEDGTERWVYRQAIMNGQMKITRAKAAMAPIACTFMLEKPLTGLRLWKAILASPLRD